MFILISGSINVTFVSKYDVNVTQSHIINHQFTLIFYFIFPDYGRKDSKIQIDFGSAVVAADVLDVLNVLVLKRYSTEDFPYIHL